MHNCEKRSCFAQPLAYSKPMIGQLKGMVEEIDDGRVLLDVNGVGYVVYASSRTLGSLAIGETAKLLIETQVREDAITLFGFAAKAEQQLFRTLTTVQGVGAKVGLALLSTLAPQELVQAIALGDAKSLARADGVGPKLASRIANELKDKIATHSGGSFMNSAAITTASIANDTVGDAVTALAGLGYRRADIVPVVTQLAARAPDAPLDQLIKSALKELAT